MKKYLIFFLLFLFSSLLLHNDTSNYILSNNYKIISSFCDHKDNHFNTGLDLIAKNDEMFHSIFDGEVIFYNKNRFRNIKYNNGNLLVVEDKENKLRASYFNLRDNFTNENIFILKKGEQIGRPKYSVNLNEFKLYIEVEDIENNKVLNPMQHIFINDTIQPRILDIYFITDENEIISLKEKGEYKIKRGGKIFIKCFDKINNSNYNITPYSIKILIDGNEKASFIFDHLNKKNFYYTINKNKLFEDIYYNKEPFDFYIMDFYGLPGLVGFKAIVEDFNGNKTIFKSNLKILPPEQSN